MRVIAYDDGESIKTLMVHEIDFSACLTNLQNEGYLIIGEEKVPVPKGRNFDRYPQLEGDERR